jgi:hypothetical protein
VHVQLKRSSSARLGTVLVEEYIIQQRIESPSEEENPGDNTVLFLIPVHASSSAFCSKPVVVTLADFPESLYLSEMEALNGRSCELQEEITERAKELVVIDARLEELLEKMIQGGAPEGEDEIKEATGKEEDEGVGYESARGAGGRAHNGNPRDVVCSGVVDN